MMLDYKKLLESLLRELIDKKIISEWYCNGVGYFWKYNEKDNRIEELENKIVDIKANCDLAIEGRDVKITELEQQIKKMRCCSNCRYKYKYCSWTSETIKDGKITSHYWNKEKQAYCDVGEGAEYQLWEIRK